MIRLESSLQKENKICRYGKLFLNIFVWVLFFEIQNTFAFSVDSLPVWNDSVLKNPDYHSENNDSKKKSDSAFASNLETSGSKTISVVVGDGGTEIDQELRLSLRGYAMKDVYIEALLSDVGRTAGDQSTATLQEVDQIYFRVESPHAMIHLGDLTWKQNTMGLFGTERATLGVMAGMRTGTKETQKNYTEVRGAYGIDEEEHYAVVLAGNDGQRDGYIVDQSFGFLSIVPESEKVWLNGVLLKRDKDYTINYAGGVIDFKGSILPGSGDEIRVEYDAYRSGYASKLLAAKGLYRSPHIWLDVAGFRLENDVERLKRNAWDDADWETLKKDDGGVWERADSLPELSRPMRSDLFGTRIRTAFNNAFFDGEIAFLKKDSNTVSDKIKGPEGRAFRYLFETDSSASLKNFPIAFGFYGNYYENGFESEMFQGSDRDWDSFLLRDSWDLNEEQLGSGRRHEAVFTRFRLTDFIFGRGQLGYRQSNVDSSWNSMRAEAELYRQSSFSNMSLSFVRVHATDSLLTKRTQGILNAAISDGFFRPFASGDYAYWERENKRAEKSPSAKSSEVIQIKQDAGFSLVGKNFEVREAVGSKRNQVREQEKAYADSLKQISWTQTSTIHFDLLEIEHLLQYKRTDLQEEGVSNVWLSSQTIQAGSAERGVEGSLHYDFGLTKEQPYIAIYKAVAPGTGDVLYDSTTGLFVEGVDNGDFVYEGMGRSDSSQAVEASKANAEFQIAVSPGVLLGIKQGFGRDVMLGLEYRGEAYDTTGKKVFLPPFSKKETRKLTSGLFYYEGNVAWNISVFSLLFNYYPGLEFEKKNLIQNYEQSRNWHRLEGTFSGHSKEIWNADFLTETTTLNAAITTDWNAKEGNLKYRRELPMHFFVEPGVMLRYVNGEQLNKNFESKMWQGIFKIGYLNEDKIDVSLQGSTIHVNTNTKYLPYQAMSGYSDGWTFRIEAVAEISLSSFLTLSSHYIIRFGNSESHTFQKWSMEARAFL